MTEWMRGRYLLDDGFELIHLYPTVEYHSINSWPDSDGAWCWCMPETVAKPDGSLLIKHRETHHC